MKAISAREAAPEKVLMRDYIDSRFNFGRVPASGSRGDLARDRGSAAIGRA